MTNEQETGVFCQLTDKENVNKTHNLTPNHVRIHINFILLTLIVMKKRNIMRVRVCSRGENATERVNEIERKTEYVFFIHAACVRNAAEFSCSG